MLNDKQSLLLCGFLIGIYFVCGVLDVMDNFATKALLSLVFLMIVANLIYVIFKVKKENRSQDNS